MANDEKPHDAVKLQGLPPVEREVTHKLEIVDDPRTRCDDILAVCLVKTPAPPEVFLPFCRVQSKPYEGAMVIAMGKCIEGWIRVVLPPNVEAFVEAKLQNYMGEWRYLAMTDTTHSKDH